MGSSLRIEESLQSALDRASAPGAPPILAEAMEYAVFPGGQRLRPGLCLAVSGACRDRASRHDDVIERALVPATAIELMHCASLVHDDLPCFDDADIRRGKPSVHCAYGEPVAVLVGDALIVLAMDTLARGAADQPQNLPALMKIVCESVGPPGGIIAGQAWESEPYVDIGVYHRAKTAAMFVAACESGAVCAGADPVPWRRVGVKIGEAYQALDDLRDVLAAPHEIGKPVAQDRRLKRPSALEASTPDDVAASVRRSLNEALAAVPVEADAGELARLLDAVVGRFLGTLNSSWAA
jgi:geranylgeranyl diphosphate synthase type II